MASWVLREAPSRLARPPVHTDTPPQPPTPPPPLTPTPRSLEYIKEAVAEADPVMGLAGLIKQRRRWLNGTFFAMIYTLSNWARIWTESHHTWVAVGQGRAA